MGNEEAIPDTGQLLYRYISRRNSACKMCHINNATFVCRNCPKCTDSQRAMSKFSTAEILKNKI